MVALNLCLSVCVSVCVAFVCERAFILIFPEFSSPMQTRTHTHIKQLL